MDVPLRAVPGRRCRVLFSYQPANDDELELQVGDLIDILSEVEEGWWRGKLNGQIGVFPSNFVSEVLDDEPGTKEASHRKTSRSSMDSQSNASTMNHEDPAAASDVPELPPKPMKELCRVMFPYDAVNDDELTLREGDIITLISRDGQDKGWWRGELNGKVGVFPDNFIQVITTDESTKPARPPAKTNIVTTNRVKDSITRPTTTPQTTASRKSIELPPKLDEKTSPPGISKKPQLPPPPLKKPQRSPSGASINKTLGVSQSEAKTSATTPTKPPESPTNTGSSARIPLTPLTFSLKQASTSDGVDGGCLSRNSGSFAPTTDIKIEADMDLDCIGRTAMLTHPTASRVRAPRRRPPSGVPVKESSESTGLVNGSAEPHLSILDDKVTKAPWVEELKMNQAKKNSAQGRSRVMISGGSGAGEPPASVSPEPLKISPVTLRGPGSGQTGSRPQSMFGGRSFSLSPSPSSPDTITVSNKQWNELNEKVQRLESKLDAQQEAFMKAIKDLTAKLSEESDRRSAMQTEIEKLANFVTQV